MVMSRYKPVGWRHDSYRHYLAAKGISSTYFTHKRRLFGERKRVIVNPEEQIKRLAVKSWYEQKYGHQGGLARYNREYWRLRGKQAELTRKSLERADPYSLRKDDPGAQEVRREFVKREVLIQNLKDARAAKDESRVGLLQKAVKRANERVQELSPKDRKVFTLLVAEKRLAEVEGRPYATAQFAGFAKARIKGVTPKKVESELASLRKQLGAGQAVPYEYVQPPGPSYSRQFILPSLNYEDIEGPVIEKVPPDRELRRGLKGLGRAQGMKPSVAGYPKMSGPGPIPAGERRAKLVRDYEKFTSRIKTPEPGEFTGSRKRLFGKVMPAPTRKAPRVSFKKYEESRLSRLKGVQTGTEPRYVGGAVISGAKIRRFVKVKKASRTLTVGVGKERKKIISPGAVKFEKTEEFIPKSKGLPKVSKEPLQKPEEKAETVYTMPEPKGS